MDSSPRPPSFSAAARITSGWLPPRFPTSFHFPPRGAGRNLSAARISQFNLSALPTMGFFPLACTDSGSFIASEPQFLDGHRRTRATDLAGGRANRLQPTPFFLSHQRIDLSTVCHRSFFLPMQRAYARLRGNESSWLGPAKLKRPTAQPRPAPASA